MYRQGAWRSGFQLHSSPFSWSEVLLAETHRCYYLIFNSPQLFALYRQKNSQFRDLPLISLSSVMCFLVILGHFTLPANVTYLPSLNCFFPYYRNV